MTRLLPVALVTALCACVRPNIEPDVAPPKLWTVDVAIRSTTKRADGLPLDSALAGLAEVLEERRFSVRGERVFRHSDGSRSTRFAFLGEDPLAGRVVDMRHFESGEILALEWLEHAAGPGPAIDVVSPVFAWLSPKVPLLRRGQEGLMITSWPVEVGPDRKVTERIRTTWTHLGTQRVLGRAAHALQYEGEWETRGEDAGHRPAVGVEGRGHVAGSLWLDLGDLSVVAHDFDWNRRLVLAYPNAPGGGLELVQRQHFAGRVEQQAVGP